MFDKRNKLSAQVDIEARKHFKNKVYKTVVPRNVRLSEAPSHGMPCLIYDKNVQVVKSYINLAEEFINCGKSITRERSMNAAKKGLGRGLSALFGDIDNKSSSSRFKH